MGIISHAHVCIYWRIIHRASLQNASNKPMKFHDDNQNNTQHVRISNTRYKGSSTVIKECYFITFQMRFILCYFTGRSQKVFPDLVKNGQNKRVGMISPYRYNVVPSVVWYNMNEQHSPWPPFTEMSITVDVDRGITWAKMHLKAKTLIFWKT